MRAWVAVTDKDWYRFLSRRSDFDEINFWQPGGNRGFHTLAPGEPFLFKLHYPDNAIVGGGFFTHSSRVPTSVAWDAFGEKNGAISYEEMCRASSATAGRRSILEDSTRLDASSSRSPSSLPRPIGCRRQRTFCLRRCRERPMT